MSASSSAFGTVFSGLMNEHSAMATEIGKKYAEDHVKNQELAVGAWAVSMAPVFVINIAIIIAKVISAILFFVAPIVFILALIGVQQNYLGAWVKAILVTFLTVIIVYVVGVFILNLMKPQMIELINTQSGNTDSPISITKLAPVGVLAIFGVIIVTQATSIASSIIGAAAINTQQATGVLQIGALQGANKISQKQGQLALAKQQQQSQLGSD